MQPRLNRVGRSSKHIDRCGRRNGVLCLGQLPLSTIHRHIGLIDPHSGPQDSQLPDIVFAQANPFPKLHPAQGSVKHDQVCTDDVLTINSGFFQKLADAFSGPTDKLAGDFHFVP